MHTAVEQGKQIIGNDALDDIAVDISQPDPQAVEFGTAEEGFAFGLKAVTEFPNEINSPDFFESNRFVLAFNRQEIDVLGGAERRRV